MLSNRLLPAAFFFGLLYFVQGASVAYFQSFQKPYLLDQGVALSHIGVLTTLLLSPFVLKIFLGWISDRYSFFGLGHRRPYVVLGILLSSLGFVLASTVAPGEHFLIFACSVLIASFGVAWMDSAADGWAIDRTREQDTALVQATIVGGRALGLVVFSLGIGRVAQQSGYESVFWMLAVVVVSPLFFLMRMPDVRKKPVDNPSPTVQKPKPSVLRLFLGSSGGVVLYAVFYSVWIFGADGLIALFARSRFQVSQEFLGQLGAFRGLGAVAGAWIAGALVLRHHNFRRRVFAALAALAGLCCVFVFVFKPGQVLVLGFVWGALWAVHEATFLALAMRWSPKNWGAAGFAAIMACSNFGTALGDGLATRMVDWLGWSTTWFVLGAGVAVTIFVLGAQLRRWPQPAHE